MISGGPLGPPVVEGTGAGVGGSVPCGGCVDGGNVVAAGLRAAPLSAVACLAVVVSTGPAPVWVAKVPALASAVRVVPGCDGGM